MGRAAQEGPPDLFMVISRVPSHIYTREAVSLIEIPE
jgi:hypothetical protein